MRLSTTHRRAGLAALATSLVIGGTVAGAGTAHAEASFDFERLAGDNRYATSAEAAERFGSTNTVVLASGEDGRYPDALAASYLAGLRDAPVLLTRKDVTPDVVKAAIDDSGARNIVIVGGESAVSKAQEDELAQDYSVKRLAGDNRYGTATEIITEGGDAGTDTALLATGIAAGERAMQPQDQMHLGTLTQPVVAAQIMSLAEQGLLEINPGLQADTVFADLQRRYPGRFADGQLRTLQRRRTRGPKVSIQASQTLHVPEESVPLMLLQPAK